MRLVLKSSWLPRYLDNVTNEVYLPFLLGNSEPTGYCNNRLLLWKHDWISGAKH